ncbi:MAG TPA: cbb3-type cytochrome c oxidase subunit I [Patescibacteria group bacterium]|nr:cbb3-type cytochrome c oxidase subunit I [Patescibacteria group bacterium]
MPDVDFRSDAAVAGTIYLPAEFAPAQRRLARAWLWLGMTALIGSGLFAILLVVSRTPGLQDLFPVADFFRLALVVHVDLSVLVWFVAMAGMLWSLNARPVALPLARSALILSALGTLGMLVAPFAGSREALMANYIPVLDGHVFLAALVVFGFGSMLLVAHALVAAPRPGRSPAPIGALQFGSNASAVAMAVALIAFAWSWAVMPPSLDGKAYYEVLFWGGGHALQFTWTILMLLAWLWLAGACGGRVLLSPRLVVLMFALALVSVFVTPYAYLAHDIATVEHRNLHTWAMRIGGGLAIAPVMLAVIQAMLQRRPLSDAQRPLRAALWSSMAIFALGGVIGIVIAGNNVRIPAHYHGSIVGVTLALMGLVYFLLPRLGHAAPDSRLARVQPTVYAIGQALHILGLVWSGGYGVQRKVAGAEQVLRTPSEIAGMGVMGLGGLVAIIGGLLFVVVVLRAMRLHPDKELRA